MEPLKIRWKSFFNAVLDPWNLLLFVFCVVFYILSLSQSNILLYSLAFVVITFASAILGSRVTRMLETNIIKSRGHSAVKSLKLLLGQIMKLSERSEDFRKETSTTKISPKVTMRNYEEIILNCVNLREQVVNSIENWTDIIPEADLKTLIGEFSKISKERDDKENELSELKKELKDERGKNEKERKLLINQIKEKEDSIRNLNNQLIERGYGLGIGQTSPFIDPLHLTPSTLGDQLPILMSRLRTIFPHRGLLLGTKSEDKPEEEGKE